MKRYGLLGALTALALSVSCEPYDPTRPPAPKHQLEGSAITLFDLGYDEARILLAEQDVALLFVRTRPLVTIFPDGGVQNQQETGVSEDYPLKVSYALWGSPMPVNTRVDLAEVSAGMAKTPRAVISRDVLLDPRKKYPRVQRGSMIFNSAPVAGATVRGDFNITFTNGTETASGRTVFGSFDAKVAQ